MTCHKNQNVSNININNIIRSQVNGLDTIHIHVHCRRNLIISSLRKMIQALCLIFGLSSLLYKCEADTSINEQVICADGSTSCQVPNNATNAVDLNPNCEFWAKEGECDINPRYMKVNCVKSCLEYGEHRNRNNNRRKNSRSSSSAQTETDTVDTIETNQCQYYMAESSIPKAGLGLYTAVPIPKNQDIFHSDIVIQIPDYEYHQELQFAYENIKQNAESSIEYIDKHELCSFWAEEGECDNNPGYMLKSCKRSCTPPSEEINLFDANKNCMYWASVGECDKNPSFMLDKCKKSCTHIPSPEDLPKNAEWMVANYYWNSRNTHSSYDAEVVESLIPGLGMLANSHTGLVNANMKRPDIDSATMNRMYDPGVGAFSTYHNLKFHATQDIPAGMEIFVEYGDEWFSEREKKFGILPLSNNFVDADRILNHVSNFLDTEENVDETFMEDMLYFIKNDLTVEERLRMILPTTSAEAEEAFERGSAVLTVPNAIRSQKWLQENGRCVDNIVPGMSTMDQAGRGAFATRNIAKGQVIAPAPLVHINRTDLHMYNEDEPDNIQGEYGEIIHETEQLLLNYCYGNTNSSLLFFPYAPVVNFINHNPDRELVNAEIRWSDIANHHQHWFDYSAQELISQSSTGLVMEFVALRDIQEGEEIFIYYGDSWQKAWETHLLNWSPPNDSTSHYKPIEDLNAEEKIIKTKSEQRSDPYPDNALLLCFISKSLWDLDDHEIKSSVTFLYEDNLTRFIDYARPCVIEERLNDFLYNVVIRTPSERMIAVEKVPRWAIEFVENQYHSDQHILGAFRHEIEIPVEMFPDSWMDLKSYDENKVKDHKFDDEPYETCRYYMAESSIPGAGLGIYSGVNLYQGNLTQPEIVIHIDDFTREQKDLLCEIAEEICGKDLWWMPHNYEWNGSASESLRDAETIAVLFPGMGALSNFHTDLYRARIGLPQRGNVGLDRFHDPSAGSISQFDYARFRIQEDIPAGMEIFISYGEAWLFGREKKIGKVPLKNHFTRTDEIIKDFFTFLAETHPESSNDELPDELWSFIRNDLVLEDRLRIAMPDDVLGAKDAALKGKSAYLSVPNVVRPIEWLKENGRCLDEIKIGPSTIPGAGRGAFARRNLNEGEIISTAPLFQLDRKYMTIRKKENDEVVNVRKRLIMNYSYGHPKSNVLLFPYSSVVNAINHNSLDKVNAKIQWSSMSFHHSDWLNLSASEVLDKQHTGVIMEFIATRDIQEGEEIFIDYGPRWSQAWDHHKWNWQPLTEDEYIPAWEYNTMNIPILTIKEQESNPYPNNISLGCILPREFFKYAKKRMNNQNEEEYIWFHEDDLVNEGSLESCDVLERTEGMKGSGIYTVLLHTDDAKSNNKKIARIPEKYFKFIDNSYTLDEYLVNAFRHEIGFPEALFPKSWIDI